MLSALACSRELQSWGGGGRKRIYYSEPDPQNFQIYDSDSYASQGYDSRVQLVLGLEKFNINNSLTVAK